MLYNDLMANVVEEAKLAQLTSVAIMKYKLGLSQAEIAKRMNVSSMTISRLLDTALNLGIIKISVETSIKENSELSQIIRDLYGLKDAVIVSSQMFEDSLTTIAKASANYLDLVVTDKDKLGIAAGRTLGNVLPFVRFPFITDSAKFEVIQLQGGSFIMGQSNPVTSIGYFVNRFSAKGFLLQQPMYAPTEASLSLIHDNYLPEFERKWKSCSILLTGVGHFNENCLQMVEGLFSEEDFEELREKRAIGDLFGRWFGEDGEYLDCSCNRRLISIPSSFLSDIPVRILVSSGAEKIPSIKAVLNKRYLNVLITDEVTARGLL